MAAAAPRPKLLVIVGPTASGKSQLSVKIAKKFNGEIISADSWTVYKGFDIGTAKPSAADREVVAHHLLDVADPAEGFNAPAFKKLAEAAIEDILNKGKLSILVGGTGLYIDSLLYNFKFLPAYSDARRAELNDKSIEDLLIMAVERNIDLSGIDIRNKRRVIRAIETRGQRPEKSALRPRTLIVGLDLGSQKLRSNIEHRVKTMIASGLEQEVKGLSEKYGWEAEPMKGIGYREWQEYFNGRQTLEQTEQRIVSGNMNLAKRQRTWQKRNKNIVWFQDPASAFNYVSSILNN